MDTAERAGSRWEIPISDPDQAYPALSSLGREVGKVSLRQLAGAANQSSKYLGLREACWCLDNDVPRWPGCGQRSAPAVCASEEQVQPASKSRAHPKAPFRKLCHLGLAPIPRHALPRRSQR
jgi:hypothetical protein